MPSAPTAVAPASAAVDAAADAPASSNAGAEPVAHITSPCVLHAGEGTRHTRKIRLPGGAAGPESSSGSCSANAECLLDQVQATAGDGSVRLECSGRFCTCSAESISPRDANSSFTFELAAPCTTSSQALDVIVERCMVGMTVVGREQGESHARE
ncbi:MAG: hypothetical protein JW940_18525 [Polyangiaceae bacterium]|nr:hypothetical protein [Polyangiaceae bacterium]